MNVSSAGGIAWSWVPMTAQDGMVAQAGGPDGAVNASESKGALNSSEDRRFGGRHVGGEAGVEAGVIGPGSNLQVEVVVACRLGGIHDEVEDVVKVTPAGETGTRPSEGQLFEGFALGRFKGVHVNKSFDIRVPVGGIGDDCAPVRMAHEHDGPRDRAEVAGQIGRIARQPPQWVGRRIDGIALVLQDRNNVVPARSVGPSTVHEHDRGLRPTRAVLRLAPGAGLRASEGRDDNQSSDYQSGHCGPKGDKWPAQCCGRGPFRCGTSNCHGSSFLLEVHSKKGRDDAKPSSRQVQVAPAYELHSACSAAAPGPGSALQPGAGQHLGPSGQPAG